MHIKANGNARISSENLSLRIASFWNVVCIVACSRWNGCSYNWQLWNYTVNRKLRRIKCLANAHVQLLYFVKMSIWCNVLWRRDCSFCCTLSTKMCKMIKMIESQTIKVGQNRKIIVNCLKIDCNMGTLLLLTWIEFYKCFWENRKKLILNLSLLSPYCRCFFFRKYQ